PRLSVPRSCAAPKEGRAEATWRCRGAPAPAWGAAGFTRGRWPVSATFLCPGPAARACRRPHPRSRGTAQAREPAPEPAAPLRPLVPLPRREPPAAAPLEGLPEILPDSGFLYQAGRPRPAPALPTAPAKCSAPADTLRR